MIAGNHFVCAGIASCDCCRTCWKSHQERHPAPVRRRGRLHIFAGKLPGPVATVRIHQPGLETKIFLNPELRAGEAYMDGNLTVEEGSTIHDYLRAFSETVDDDDE